MQETLIVQIRCTGADISTTRFRLGYEFGRMGTLGRDILQRMNADAFPHPEQLMENIAGVTGVLKKEDYCCWAASGEGDVKYHPDRGTANRTTRLTQNSALADVPGYHRGAGALIQVANAAQVYESAWPHWQLSSGFWRIIRQRHSMRQFRKFHDTYLVRVVGVHKCPEDVTGQGGTDTFLA